MLFLIISIFIPLLTYFGLPYLLQRHYKDAAHKHKILLFAGSLLFFISWYLPSPLIDGQDTAFMTHFVGGGVFSGFVWLYITKTIDWNTKNIFIEAASLYAFVSALGVLNELAELFFVKIHLAHLSLTDTSWDLLANTLGAFTFFICYRATLASTNKS